MTLVNIVANHLHTHRHTPHTCVIGKHVSDPPPHTLTTHTSVHMNTHTNASKHALVHPALLDTCFAQSTLRLF